MHLKTELPVELSNPHPDHNSDLRTLYIACFFERRLPKPTIQSLNLSATLSLLHSLLSTGSLSFVHAAPLLLGLVKLYYKKMSYLLNETTQTLESLKSPFEEMEAKKRRERNGDDKF